MRLPIAGALLLGATCPASAHAFLDHAAPGAGAAMTPSPPAIILDFSEDLEPAFSGIAVNDAAGRDVSSAVSSVSGHEMRLALKPLGPGSYRVRWHAVSTDTHRTEGSYAFTVKK